MMFSKNIVFIKNHESFNSIKSVRPSVFQKELYFLQLKLKKLIISIEIGNNNELK